VRALAATRSAGAASAHSANDFESAVLGLHPQLKKLYAKLRKACASSLVNARMTGSGSALFAVFESVAQREQARRAFEAGGLDEDVRVVSANLVSGSGYRQLWRRQLGAHISLKKTQHQQWPLQSRYST
jgi:4-diphosphocytidyl-2C-methyl-D-erythritol kinase